MSDAKKLPVTVDPLKVAMRAITVALDYSDVDDVVGVNALLMLTAHASVELGVSKDELVRGISDEYDSYEARKKLEEEAAPTCDGKCGRKLTLEDKRRFEAEAGFAAGWPRCCEDCADLEAAHSPLPPEKEDVG